MKNAKSILIGTGSFVLAGLILTLFAPKAAHAIAATMVLVTNTTASPVVSQSILPGKPFVQSGTCSQSDSCTLSPPVPAVEWYFDSGSEPTVVSNSAAGTNVVTQALFTGYLTQ